MQAEWRNAAHSILALTTERGHVVIVEPGHALWASASSRPDIAPFVPEPVPAPATEADRRAAWRETRTLSRAQFCIAVKHAGFLTAAQAEAAARGDIPAPLEALFATMPAAEAEDGRILWAGLTQVERRHPLVLLVAQHMTLADEQVDALFGWSD